MIIGSSLLGAALVVDLVTAYISGPDNQVMAIAMQSSGKSVIGGKFMPSRIERMNTDGSVDASFSSTWSTGGFNGNILALAVQPDDKIVVVGQFTSFDTSIAGYITRLNADGSLDTGFANAIGTGFNDFVTALALQADGRILVGGQFSAVNGHTAQGIARLMTDGSLDTSFRSDAGFDGAVRTISAMPDGRIAVGGTFQNYGNSASPYFIYLSAAGVPDTSQ